VIAVRAIGICKTGFGPILMIGGGPHPLVVTGWPARKRKHAKRRRFVEKPEMPPFWEGMG
jgi:hypothetical protein